MAAIRTILVALLAVLVLAIAAGAEEATRESYREAAEPICKANTQANERILAGVRSEVRQGKLKAAARRFEKAGKALRATLAELKALPRPAADRDRLSRWFGLIDTEVGLFAKTARYLAAGNKRAAQGMVVRLEGVAARANNVVFPFEFEYCRFEPSRFT